MTNRLLALQKSLPKLLVSFARDASQDRPKPEFGNDWQIFRMLPSPTESYHIGASSVLVRSSTARSPVRGVLAPSSDAL